MVLHLPTTVLVSTNPVRYPWIRNCPQPHGNPADTTSFVAPRRRNRTSIVLEEDGSVSERPSVGRTSNSSVWIFTFDTRTIGTSRLGKIFPAIKWIFSHSLTGGSLGEDCSLESYDTTLLFFSVRITADCFRYGGEYFIRNSKDNQQTL